MKLKLQRWWLAFGLGLWMASVIAGSVLLWRYSSSAGSTAVAPTQLPIQFRAVRSQPQPVLLMAVHPHCPCSRASLAELAKILTHYPSACHVIMLVFKPESQPALWSETGLCQDARRLNCEIRIDENGTTAHALGMLTSGQVLLYDAAGVLRFQGGITSGRGHQGDNDGQVLVERILEGEVIAPAQRPVYGCSLVRVP